ncbi:MAG: metallophosphoesterase [Eubacteriales bacterium]|nr:metallophosphoesterase [Eubacteriales bacterium]
MKILVLADKESLYLWDFFEKEKLEGIDLILSCGDLHPQYLSFLATFFSGPVLYVHGNHDGCYRDTPPEGCICVEDRIYEYKGVRILGLGGSMLYSGGPHQYTQKQMDLRILRLAPKLWFHKGFDILLTHSPALGLHDGTDLPHTGFQGFLKLMDRFHPRLFVHGHVHMSYDRTIPRRSFYGDTAVVNAYERYVIDL